MVQHPPRGRQPEPVARADGLCYHRAEFAKPSSAFIQKPVTTNRFLFVGRTVFNRSATGRGLAVRGKRNRAGAARRDESRPSRNRSGRRGGGPRPGLPPGRLPLWCRSFAPSPACAGVWTARATQGCSDGAVTRLHVLRRVEEDPRAGRSLPPVPPAAALAALIAVSPFLAALCLARPQLTFVPQEEVYGKAVRVLMNFSDLKRAWTAL
mgnify:CR=1 FL=1